MLSYEIEIQKLINREKDMKEKRKEEKK